MQRIIRSLGGRKQRAEAIGGLRILLKTRVGVEDMLRLYPRRQEPRYHQLEASFLLMRGQRATNVPGLPSIPQGHPDSCADPELKGRHPLLAQFTFRNSSNQSKMSDSSSKETSTKMVAGFYHTFGSHKRWHPTAMVTYLSQVLWSSAVSPL